eukprot:UN31130
MDRQDRKKDIIVLKKADVNCGDRVQWRVLVKLLLIKYMNLLFTAPRTMEAKTWRDVVKYVGELIVLLNENPQFRLHNMGILKLHLTDEERQKASKEKDSSRQTFVKLQDKDQDLDEVENLVAMGVYEPTEEKEEVNPYKVQ